jgi:hypothetical protein
VSARSSPPPLRSSSTPRRAARHTADGALARRGATTRSGVPQHLETGARPRIRLGHSPCTTTSPPARHAGADARRFPHQPCSRSGPSKPASPASSRPAPPEASARAPRRPPAAHRCRCARKRTPSTGSRRSCARPASRPSRALARVGPVRAEDIARQHARGSNAATPLAKVRVAPSQGSAAARGRPAGQVRREAGVCCVPDASERVRPRQAPATKRGRTVRRASKRARRRARQTRSDARAAPRGAPAVRQDVRAAECDRHQARRPRARRRAFEPYTRPCGTRRRPSRATPSTTMASSSRTTA